MTLCHSRWLGGGSTCIGSSSSAGGSTSMGSTPSAAAAPPAPSLRRLHFCLGSIAQLAVLPRRRGQPSPQVLLRPAMAGNRESSREISEWWARRRGFYRPQDKGGADATVTSRSLCDGACDGAPRPRPNMAVLGGLVRPERGPRVEGGRGGSGG